MAAKIHMDPGSHVGKANAGWLGVAFRLAFCFASARARVVVPCNSDTYRVSEADSTQIEKVSLFYRSTGICA